MAASRYETRKIRRNANRLYTNVFKERDVKFIRQYTSPSMPLLTAVQAAKLSALNHTWTLGDRYYKLASKHYGDGELWWVIAWFNKMPTESHLKLGDIVQIPFPLERVLSYYGV